MLSLSLFLAACATLLTLLAAARTTRALAPEFRPEWRSGDVLSRRTSTVDYLHASDYRPEELFDEADHLRRIVREGVDTSAEAGRAARAKLAYAALLDDMGQRVLIARRIEHADLKHRRDHRVVRAVYHAVGVGA